VVGVGGVGSWTVEALARSGLGAITMIDLDDVCITNTNRQLPAIEGEYGRPKVDVLADRVRAIQPDCRVVAVAEYFTEASADDHLATRFDFVVDAIDKLRNKCVLISECRRRELPVITIGGAGGKRTGAGIRIGDLAFSENDSLLKFVRRTLRQDFGFSRGSGEFGVPCVYSAEQPVYPWADGSVCAAREPESPLALDCASGFGTAVFVTAAFGLAAAGEVVRRIALAQSPAELLRAR
jgi:tRNA A37 threonylcarbamoyladenosine dehydratase